MDEIISIARWMIEEIKENPECFHDDFDTEMIDAFEAIIYIANENKG